LGGTPQEDQNGKGREKSELVATGDSSEDTQTWEAPKFLEGKGKRDVLQGEKGKGRFAFGKNCRKGGAELL